MDGRDEAGKSRNDIPGRIINLHTERACDGNFVVGRPIIRSISATPAFADITTADRHSCVLSVNRMRYHGATGVGGMGCAIKLRALQT